MGLARNLSRNRSNRLEIVNFEAEGQERGRSSWRRAAS